MWVVCSRIERESASDGGGDVGWRVITWLGGDGVLARTKLRVAVGDAVLFAVCSAAFDAGAFFASGGEKCGLVVLVFAGADGDGCIHVFK